MKMISSTRSTSIIGVTLMSDWTPAEAPVVIAMLLLPLLLVVRNEHGGLVGLGDGSHNPNPRPPGGFDGFLDLAVLQLIVRLEVQNLVLGPRRVQRAQLVFQ